MSEVDSGSLTPPLSPFGFMEEDIPSPPIVEQADIEDVSPAPCFTCCGEVMTRGDNFHTGGFWRSNILSRLDNHEVLRSHVDPVPGRIPSLFGSHWSRKTVLDNDLDRLFLILRQHIGEIQMLAAKSRLVIDSEAQLYSLKDKRKQVNSFLDFLLEHISRCPELSERCLENLAQHLHALLLHLDRISELPAHVRQAPAAGADTGGGACHLSFHLSLDIYWRVLAIFHIIQVKFPGFRYSSRLCLPPDEDSQYLYDELLHLILWDLVSLAHLQYLTKVVGHEYTRTCMFTCTCVRELWLLVLKLTEYRAANNMGETFWIHLHHVIKGVCDMDRDTNTCLMEIDDSRMFSNPPDGLRVDDPVSLTLWTLTNVAPLYAEKSPLTYKGDGSLVENYHDLQTILKKLLTAPSLPETLLRRHLRACLQLTNHWQPNTNILIILWDYFYKKLNQNEMFQTGGGVLEGLAGIDQSVAGLYDRCNGWTRDPLNNLEKDTSYQLFLRILALHLGKLYTAGSTQEWKQIKGRIYSKFHPRRVRELMEGGLYNLTCLFVTLALTTDLEDVASKLCDFYDMLDIGSISFACRGLVWRGAFALMLVYEQKHADISFLADRMVAAFTNCVSDFKVAGVDTRHSMWKLINTFLEGTQEVVDLSRCLDTSEHKLICDGIKSLLISCGKNELRSILSALQAIISKFRHVTSLVEKEALGPVRHSLQHTEFAGQLWRTVYHFICDHATTLTPPTQVADIAAAMCMMVFSFPPLECTGSNDTFLSVFKYFACGEKVNISVSCRFLSHLLSRGEVMEQLQQQLDQYETFIVRAWIRCFLQVPSGSQQLAEVTRPVLQLVEVRQIFEDAGVMVPDQDLEATPVHFLKALEKSHRHKESWESKMKFQQQVIRYFSDVPKYVSSPCRTNSELMSVMYRMVGYILKYCSRLIYIQQDLIIPNIISTMVVPHSVLNPDKPVNPGLLAVLRDTLHLYIQGLGKLAYDRDPFVQRRLKDIIMVYLPKYSLPSPTSSLSTNSVMFVHPVVASLSGSFIQQPLPETIQFRHHIMSLVILHFLTVKNFTIHPNHTLGLSFLYDVLQRTTSPQVKASDLPVVIGPCLEYLLLLPDHSPLTPGVISLLQTTADAFTQHTNPLQSDVTGALQKFITTYFKYSVGNVIKVLEKLAVLLPNSVIRVIQLLSRCVQEIENKRGVGVDHHMRKKYFSLLQLMGEEGKVEIARLQGSS